MSCLQTILLYMIYKRPLCFQHTEKESEERFYRQKYLKDSGKRNTIVYVANVLPVNDP